MADVKIRARLPQGVYEHPVHGSTVDEDVHRMRARPASEIFDVVNKLLGYQLLDLHELARDYREQADEDLLIAESNLAVAFEAIAEEE
jgi:hypothetical protein